MEHRVNLSMGQVGATRKYTNGAFWETLNPAGQFLHKYPGTAQNWHLRKEFSSQKY